MSDFERYGDYDVGDEEYSPYKPSILPKIIKIVFVLFCFAVTGFLLLRVVLFSYYPSEMKTLVYNDKLKSYYEETGGSIGAKTQELRFPYDDNNFAKFFADKLIVIEGAEQIQITLKYNSSMLEELAADFSLAEVPEPDPALFDLSLRDNYGNRYTDVGFISSDSFLMYNYIKLCFDGVPLSGDENGEFPEWICIDIYYSGNVDYESDAYATILIYENHADFSQFTDYKLSGSEILK